MIHISAITFNSNSQSKHWKVKSFKNLWELVNQRNFIYAIFKFCFRENVGKTLTENDESYILMHSLQDANIPKFLAEDVPLFKSILDDLFPGYVPPNRDHGVLEVRILTYSNEKKYCNNLQQ
jgi:hypothetical protein